MMVRGLVSAVHPRRTGNALMLILALSILAAFAAPAPLPADACAGVASIAVSGLKIVSATPHAPASIGLPPEAPQAKVPFCRVQAVMGGNIGIELWLPEKAAWNRRLLTGGVGGQ